MYQWFVSVFFLVGMILSTSAHAGTTDRVTQVHQHKTCGPIPWEAYQVAKYGQSEEHAQEVGVEGKVNVLTQQGEGEVHISNGAKVLSEGEVLALPVEGDQWVAMYLTYMDCIVKVEDGVNDDTIGKMWRDSMKAGAIKSIEDIKVFMETASTLNNPSADAWWMKLKSLLDQEMVGRDAVTDAKIATVKSDVNRVMESVAELRQQVMDLRADVAALQEAVRLLKEHNAEQDTALWKHINKIEAVLQVMQKKLDEKDKQLEEKLGES